MSTSPTSSLEPHVTVENRLSGLARRNSRALRQSVPISWLCIAGNNAKTGTELTKENRVRTFFHLSSLVGVSKVVVVR